jgi:diguanylate cyclase (GGDEF)-like protein/PAS domain S-box-containing protein
VGPSNRDRNDLVNEAPPDANVPTHALGPDGDRWLRSAVAHSSENVTIVDVDGTMKYANPAFERMLGYDTEEVVGKMNVLEYVHPDDLPHVLEETEKALSAGGIATNSVEYRFRHKDGSWRWVESAGTYLLDDPHVKGVVVQTRDITERKRTEETLREAEERFRRSFDDAAIGMALVAPNGRFLRTNRSLCEILGYPEEELLEKTFQDITYPDDLDADLDQVRRMLVGEIRTYQMEKRYFHKDGQVVWVLLSVSLVHDEEGEPLYFVSQIQDISERKALEERLEHRAFYDSLTDLPNRQLFMDRLGQALRRTLRRHKQVAVLFVDIDKFKGVNDSLGHKMGDLLLMVVAQRLGHCLRPEDTLARFGGDEFVVLIEAVDDTEQAVEVAERIAQEFRRPFNIEGRDLYVSASIGISLGNARTHDPDGLLREADTAMYRAKAEPEVYTLFDPSMYAMTFRRLELENDLRRAIEQEEFVVHYQPIVRLDNEGGIARIEALVRWDHPERGFLNPDEFVPIAEESGLVVPMGEQVLEHACRWSVEWQRRFPRRTPLLLSVNLSARQLSRPDLAETVARVLRETEMEGGCLNLDVTERDYVSTLERQSAVLDRLKGMGVQISIDDFGTIYSSLSYLKRLPADTIKIDKTFVKGLGEVVEDTAVVQMIIWLAHTLGIEVIAEWVESEEQARLLNEMGCDLAQGYYFGKPLPPEEIPALLSSETPTSGPVVERGPMPP